MLTRILVLVEIHIVNRRVENARVGCISGWWRDVRRSCGWVPISSSYCRLEAAGISVSRVFRILEG
jgi:hypothetical protein